jgi:hypothetical protein
MTRDLASVSDASRVVKRGDELRDETQELVGLRCFEWVLFESSELSHRRFPMTYDDRDDDDDDDRDDDFDAFTFSTRRAFAITG